MASEYRLIEFFEIFREGCFQGDFFLCDSKNKPPAMQGEGRSLDISNLLC